MTDPLKLNPEMNMEVHARLIARGSGEPLSGKAFLVRLFDRDFFEDDYLGECVPDAAGEVIIRFDYRAMHSGQFEDPLPDIFFVVYHNGQVVFQSKVMEDVNPQQVGEIKMGVGAVINLGTFLVPLEE